MDTIDLSVFGTYAADSAENAGNTIDPSMLGGALREDEDEDEREVDEELAGVVRDEQRWSMRQDAAAGTNPGASGSLSPRPVDQIDRCLHDRQAHLADLSSLARSAPPSSSVSPPAFKTASGSQPRQPIPEAEAERGVAGFGAQGIAISDEDDKDGDYVPSKAAIKMGQCKDGTKKSGKTKRGSKSVLTYGEETERETPQAAPSPSPYPDIAFDPTDDSFVCPRCLDICNCDKCSKRRGVAYVPIRRRRGPAGRQNEARVPRPALAPRQLPCPLPTSRAPEVLSPSLPEAPSRPTVSRSLSSRVPSPSSRTSSLPLHLPFSESVPSRKQFTDPRVHPARGPLGHVFSLDGTQCGTAVMEDTITVHLTHDITTYSTKHVRFRVEYIGRMRAAWPKHLHISDTDSHDVHGAWVGKRRTYRGGLLPDYKHKQKTKKHAQPYATILDSPAVVPHPEPPLSPKEGCQAPHPRRFMLFLPDARDTLLYSELPPGSPLTELSDDERLVWPNDHTTGGAWPNEQVQLLDTPATSESPLSNETLQNLFDVLGRMQVVDE
ncbi:hypothetical protein K488DRAFT_85859 [Vararia minispora EC-137]|uniref:Uncharacterized protein n=1 Tax=Vararia minispora EC-137 TaxID=1314806 RepID=A0ACB8QL79_9AGAM|nr:hypothetical protein K488DRAFT_85859 [Vararia minispora EC-137]